MNTRPIGLPDHSWPLHTLRIIVLAQRFTLSLKSAEIRKEELERWHRREHGIVRPLPEAFAEFLRALGQRQGRTLSSLQIDDARKRAETKGRRDED